MFRFPFRIAAFALCLFSQAGVVLSAEEGSYVRGTVSFRGTLPVSKKIPVTADADLCGSNVLIQPVQVNERTLGLRNVVVSVKGVSSPTTAVSLSKQVVENVNCAFSPRVGAARVGDTLEIYNRDPILHNTHILVGKKTFLNVAQLAGSRPIPKALKRVGLHAIQCDKHTFMTGALQVFDHPYFAVTDEFGKFQLPEIPKGRYTIVVWHETLGNLEKEITIPSQGMITINFEFP